MMKMFWEEFAEFEKNEMWTLQSADDMSRESLWWYIDYMRLWGDVIHSQISSENEENLHMQFEWWRICELEISKSPMHDWIRNSEISKSLLEILRI